MTRPQFPPRSHRARDILAAVARAYPGAWQTCDRMRRDRGTGGLPDWPDWCYLPLHGAYAVVSGGGPRRVPIERAHHVGTLGALAAWRMGQQIIRYDPALYAPMVDTPIAGDLPTSLLYRLPCWCLYIETPDLTWERRALHGVWVHLDWTEHGPAELRLLLDVAESPDLALDPERGLVPVPLLLGEGTIADALDRLLHSAAAQAAARGLAMPDIPGEFADRAARGIAPLLSLVLYLCSAEPDWGRQPPRNPLPVRTRRDGWRLFPADGPTTWDVGVRLGAALRAAYQAEQIDPLRRGDTDPSTVEIRTAPRPHIRRAHWHGYWLGPRDGERRFDLRWQPPIAVRLDAPEQLPATVRPVRP